jgi:Flp pilus assembly protein TadB
VTRAQFVGGLAGLAALVIVSYWLAPGAGAVVLIAGAFGLALIDRRIVGNAEQTRRAERLAAAAREHGGGGRG